EFNKNLEKVSKKHWEFFEEAISHSPSFLESNNIQETIPIVLTFLEKKLNQFGLKMNLDVLRDFGNAYQNVFAANLTAQFLKQDKNLAELFYKMEGKLFITWPTFKIIC